MPETIETYALKYGKSFNPKQITQEGEYKATLAAEKKLDYIFTLEETGKYLVVAYITPGNIWK